MPIDDPIDAFQKQHAEKPNNPLGIAILAGKVAFPKASFLFEIFKKVYERFDKKAVEERITETSELLFNEVRYLEDTKATKLEVEDLKEAIQLTIRHDAQEFNDHKRERYVKIIGNALRSEVAVADLASFIQDVEQLGERDIIALRVLNDVMNKPTDWQEAGGRALANLHPNTFIQRRQELAVQIAQAFGMKTELSANMGQSFSHEEGYEACTRLQGFGLAHEIDTGHRQVPIGDYCFRPSKRGLQLLKLIGHHVANWEKYFPLQE